MCRVVTVIHQKETLLENNIIRALSDRQAQSKDKIAILNFGEGIINMELDNYKIVTPKDSDVPNIKKLGYDSVFIHLPLLNLKKHSDLVSGADLIILSSTNRVMNLTEYKDFNFSSVLDKTMIMFNEDN